MNTFFVSYEILFNNTLIGRGVDSVEADNFAEAVESIRQERGKKLLKEINEQQVKKGEKTYTIDNVLIFPLFAFEEKTRGTTQEKKSKEDNKQEAKILTSDNN